MFRNRNAQAEKQQAADETNGSSPLSALPEAIRIDRYGRALASSVPVLVHRLPAPDEAVEALTATAHRALEALPRPDVALPARKRRRRGPKRLVLVAVLLGAGAAAFVLVRRLKGGGDEDEWAEGVLDREWPAKPATGDTKQPPESDAQAERDAEEAAKLHTAETQP